MRFLKLILVSLALLALTACSGTQETMEGTESEFLTDLATQSQTIPEAIADSPDIPDDVKTVLGTVQEESEKWADEGKAQLEKLGETIAEDDGLTKLADEVQAAVEEVASESDVDQARTFIETTIEKRESLLEEAKTQLEETTSKDVADTAEKFVQDQTKLLEDLRKALEDL